MSKTQCYYKDWVKLFEWIASWMDSLWEAMHIFNRHVFGMQKCFIVPYITRLAHHRREQVLYIQYCLLRAYNCMPPNGRFRWRRHFWVKGYYVFVRTHFQQTLSLINAVQKDHFCAVTHLRVYLIKRGIGNCQKNYLCPVMKQGVSDEVRSSNEAVIISLSLEPWKLFWLPLMRKQ